MKKTKGIIYVAFGKEYIDLIYQIIIYSRKYTNIDISVISNIVMNSTFCKKYNINNIYLPNKKDNDNRDIKTNIINYTPYDISMFLDCDAVITKHSIEDMFNINDNELHLHLYHCWNIGDKYFNLYKKTLKKLNISLPINIYHGAFCMFTKTKLCYDFFNNWNNNWKIMGKNRDMPSLACAVKQTNIKVNNIDYFSPDGKNNKTIVHKGKYGLLDQFGIKIHTPNRSIDLGLTDSWRLVNF